MSSRVLLRASDLLGLSRLVVTLVTHTTELVEETHHTIAARPAPRAAAPQRPTGPVSQITRLVYRCVRSVTGLVGFSLDAVLRPLAAGLETTGSSPKRDAALAALNGVVGDHLSDTNNPMATRMSLRLVGSTADLDLVDLAAAVRPNRRLIVLVHGLCLDDHSWSDPFWLAPAPGATTLCLRYNSGHHISTNGREFAALLERLVATTRVDEIAIVGQSMGGLVARSAHHAASHAGHTWPHLLRTLVFIATPHHGAPLERLGNWIDRLLAASPYTLPFARLGKIRSAGITDLRYGSLLDDDWATSDRFEGQPDRRQPVPLPPGVACFAIAATTGAEIGDLKDRLIGDGLVPLDSALGRHPNPALALDLPPSSTWIGYGLHHLELLGHPEVQAQVAGWLSDPRSSTM